ncbi:MAG: hypothetical protein WDN08_03445 [Rhizomicrobium sp.]
MVVLIACGVASACTTVDTAKGPVNATYFGIVRVATQPAQSNAAAPVTALDTRALGLRFQDGLGIGYFHDQRYQVPADCRLVIFVQNQEQLDQLSRQFAGFKEGICGTIKAS